MGGRIVAFIRTGWLSYFALYTWLDHRSYMTLKVLQPFAELAFFVYLGTYFGKREPAFYLLGNALRMASWSCVIGLTVMMREERFLQTLKYLVAAPRSKFSIFAGRALVVAGDALLTVAVGLSLGMLVLDVRFDLRALDLVAATIVSACLSLAGFGLAVASLGIGFRDVNLLVNGAYALFFLFSGATVPLSELPRFVSSVSWVLPLTRAVDAVRRIAAGAGLDRVGALIVGEMVVGACYFGVACLLFSLLERRARIAGDVEEL